MMRARCIDRLLGRPLPLKSRRRTHLRLEQLESRTVPSIYNPAQMAHGYGFDQPDLPDGTVGDGTGQTIAIVDAFNAPNIFTDLQRFDLQWGLPDPNFTVATPQGQPANNNGWALEASLDVEWAHAMAPGASIVLVESLNNGYGNMLGAVDYAAQQTGASVVSMSWGSGEFSFETSSFYDGRFAGYSNLAFVASSGDSGAPPIWPSVSPNVVSVGGTRLNLDGGGNYLSETGWSGGGGGISAFESQPAYQNGVSDPWSTSQRTSPDVAYNADPGTGVYVRFNNAWYVVGGTSAGAPQWAALVAIADEGRAQLGSNPLASQDTLNAVYSLNGSADFNDITSGTSTGNPHYSAGPGYDLVTGVGSPNANLLITDLTNYTPPFGSPFNPGGGPAHPAGGVAPAGGTVHPMHSTPTLVSLQPAADTPASHPSAPATAATATISFPTATSPAAALATTANPEGGGAGTLASRAATAPASHDGVGPVSSVYRGQVGFTGISRTGTAAGTDGTADAEPAVDQSQAPPAIESPGPATAPSASPDVPTDTPVPVSLGACDACFADSFSMFGGADTQISLPFLAGGSDCEVVSGAAALAVFIGGYWRIPREEPKYRARRPRV
jgi:hypothetical protein